MAALLALLAGVAFLALSAPHAVPEPSAELVVGPVLSGDRVVWGEQAGAGSRLRTAGLAMRPRTIYATTTESDERSSRLAAVAASPQRIAFLLRSTFCRQGSPNVVYPCVGSAAVFAAAQGRSFVRLHRSRGCKSFAPFSQDGLDVTQTVVFSLESYCADEDSPLRRRIVRYGRGATAAVLRDEPSVRFACCGDIQAAGRFVAWANESSAVVYDVRARRIARRISLRGSMIAAVALQGDGTLVVVYGCRRFCRALVSRFGRPTALAIAVAPRDALRVRIADDRVVVERAVADGHTELLVSDLRGRTRRLARFSTSLRRVGDFDFDGRRVAWAQERVTSSTLDCPPPGVGRPCFWRDSGIRSIWLADVRARSFRPKLVAREQFRDLLRVGD